MATRRSHRVPTSARAGKAGNSSLKSARKRTATRALALPDPGPPNTIEFAPLHAVGGTGARAVGKRNTPNNKSRTAVYVHGIGNHPEEQVLVVRWDRALFGKDMGDRTRMAYWVNRARYPQPAACDCIAPECACHDPEETVRARRVLAMGEPQPERELEAALEEITQDSAQRDFLREMGQHMIEQARIEAAATQHGMARTLMSAGTKGTYGVQGKGFGDAVLRKLTDLITGMVLPDVQDFLFEPEQRKQMEDIFLARLRSGGGPFVVIAHSQGSMIAYDVLRQLDKAQIDVALFVTIGSPLGLPPVRAVFKHWTKQARLPFPACVTRWINIACEGDVVALDEDLSNDIQQPGGPRFENRVITRAERDANPLFTGNAHSSMGYLSTKFVQEEVYSAVGREFINSLGQQLITSDLVERMEAEPDTHRHPVLIEVTELTTLGGDSLARGRKRIDSRLRQLATLSGASSNQLDILHHARYVSAKLNRAEIEVLRSEYADLQVYRVWQNARKRALICRSAQVVQCTPAQQAYGAGGQGIEWAVLDTGIHPRHPHFATHANIASVWDCTRIARTDDTGIAEPAGGFVTMEKGRQVFPAGSEEFIDKSGHGTHVAGIIAGQSPFPLADGAETLSFAGMAPRAKLHTFKVLDDRGDGEDAWILVALDKIARINEQAQGLRIHGINLSLGGNFDPSVFGCGHTPLCVELRRLWRQGVVIVLAAGNEGFAVLQTLQDGPWQTNLDLSIGDPANLDEAIAVGSVHRTNPHTFGISYFSSRGPTADGRTKPDVVAPGEKILSARADFENEIQASPRNGVFSERALRAMTARQLYVAESGTSMAAPHVSGLIAAFLSMRREFIGYPDRVKKILLEHCTDLDRDRYAQGAGMPNLVRMLAGT